MDLSIVANRWAAVEEGSTQNCVNILRVSVRTVENCVGSTYFYVLLDFIYIVYLITGLLWKKEKKEVVGSGFP